MRRLSAKTITLITTFLITITINSHAQSTLNLHDTKNLKFINAKAEAVQYEGKEALKVLRDADDPNSQEGIVAILNGNDFKNGTIEVELAGKPKPGAPPFARGFIGIAFHFDEDDLSAYESFYLRPMNSIAETEAQRNHTVQYTSMPDYPWSRLREETPGKYETYAKVQPGKWTKMKIVVNGTTAQLFIDDEEKPCLTVNDLIRGERIGKIALWMHSTTEAYFSNLKITNSY